MSRACHVGIVAAGEPRLKGEILGDREARDEIELLEDDADLLAPQRRPSVFGEPRGLDIVDKNLAAIGMVEGADEMQQRALAAAGFAHQRQGLAGGERRGSTPLQHGQRAPAASR